MKHLETLSSSSRSDEHNISHETEKRRRAEFVFAPAIHTEENLDDIIDVLHDCSIVAVEYVGGSPQERAQDEYDFNALSSIDVPVENKLKSLARLREEGTDEFLIELSADLNKRIVLIDIDNKHAAQDARRASDDAMDGFLHALGENQPMAAFRTKMIDHIKADVRLSSMREHEMARQLEALGEENAEAKIGVVLGAVHTPVQHEVAKKFRMKRSFIGKGDILAQPEKKRFSYGEELSRHYRMLDGREPSSSLVDRALLEAFFMGYRLDGIDSSRIQVVDRMSDEDVERALVEIDQVRRKGYGVDNPILDSQIINEIEVLLTTYVNRFGEK